MKRYFRVAFASMLAASVMVACQRDRSGASVERAEGTLRLAWIPSGSYAGEVVGAKRFAAAHNLELTIQPGGIGLNPITLVQTGSSTCGAAAAEEVIAANDKGAQLSIVGVINQVAPVAFVTLTKSGIVAPKAFEGKRVGVLPFGSTRLVYQSVMERNSVDRSKVREINVSPDMRPFIEGRYDVHPVFIYDETVTLDQQGIEYNIIDPTKFGVTDFIGQVYFCRRDTVRDQPELVRSIVATLADGWRYALANQAAAIQDLKEFAPEIDPVREALVLQKGRSYFEGYEGRPLDSDLESWNAMVGELQRLGLTTHKADVDSLLALSFVKEYYNTTPKGAR